MIQKKLHIPGKMERASLEMDESWRRYHGDGRTYQVDSHVESYLNLNSTDLGEVHFSQVSTIQIHVEKSRRLDNFESHGLEIMSEMTTKPM